ncbi:hypothetical protein ABZ647_17690 [Micromonospora aurantiaca]|uniref:hypothetical protein n=1 Tax=Micromonospora aurantiaca (nom. illeg.) TaxID=47850 RepID=UPI0033F520FE
MANYPIPYDTMDYRLGDDLVQEVRRALVKAGFPELTPVDYGLLEVMLARFVYAERREVAVTIKSL